MSVQSSRILILPTGVANVASVEAALARLGISTGFVREPRDIEAAAGLIVPGVGSFGHAMQTLRTAHWIEPLKERLAALRPTLCVCLGHQLLAEASEESPGVQGLGIYSGSIARFKGDGLRVPHLGWNAVEADADAAHLTNGSAYFANAYRLTEPPEGWTPAWSDYGGRFVAGLEREGVVTCQFHPELSGEYGQQLLRRWLMFVEGGVRC